VEELRAELQRVVHEEPTVSNGTNKRGQPVVIVAVRVSGALAIHDYRQALALLGRLIHSPDEWGNGPPDRGLPTLVVEFLVQEPGRP
jgi:hypothetical protein